MSEHLSDLRLDEVVAGLQAPGSHLAACDTCTQRLARLRQDAAARRAAPGFEWTYQRLNARAAAPADPWWSWALGGLSALAVAVLVTLAPVDVNRVKAGAFLRTESHGVVLSTPRPGDRVTLVVGPAGHRFALVLSATDDHAVEQLWPAGGPASGPVPGKARVALQPEFEVTPGRVRVWALFSDRPLLAATARKALEEADRAGLPLPRLPGEIERAEWVLTPADPP